MRAQYYLGIMKSRNAITMKDKEDAGRYWDRLSALFRAFEFPNDQSFLQMQNKVRSVRNCLLIFLLKCQNQLK